MKNYYLTIIWKSRLEMAGRESKYEEKWQRGKIRQAMNYSTSSESFSVKSCSTPQQLHFFGFYF